MGMWFAIVASGSSSRRRVINVKMCVRKNAYLEHQGVNEGKALEDDIDELNLIKFKNKKGM